MNNHSEQAAGAAIGGSLGLIKSLILATTLSWSILLDTMVLAGVGAVAGYVVTNVLKFISKKYNTWKSTPKKN